MLFLYKKKKQKTFFVYLPSTNPKKYWDAFGNKHLFFWPYLIFSMGTWIAQSLKQFASRLATFLCRTDSSQAFCILAKNMEWWKNISIKPCGVYEWFDCHLPGWGGFTVYFMAARKTASFLHLHLKTVDQNASLEAELIDFVVIILKFEQSGFTMHRVIHPKDAVIHPKDADIIANSVDPDQTAPVGALIWVCPVCPGLSVRKLKILQYTFSVTLL